MNPAPTIDPKDVLSDPFASFATVYPENPADKKQLLDSLWSQTCELKDQHDALQLQSKKISRSIGEAKRNNKSIDGLKQEMQSLSQQLKQQKQLVFEHEQKILSFFNVGDKQEDNALLDGEKKHIVTDTDNNTIAVRHQTDALDSIDKITIKPLTIEHKQWNDYISKHSAGCIHHLSDWAALFEQSYGHECLYYFACDDKKNIVGTLPLVRLKSRLFGDLLVSMPFFQRAGAIADHASIEQKLIEHANQIAVDLGVDHIEYRDDIIRENMPSQSHKVNMVLTLPADSDSLWSSFSSKLRAQIKRPQREGPETHIGHTELLEDFYAVYARNMRDLGSPLHSKKFISNILTKFPDNSWLVVLKLNNKAVAAGLLLGYRETMEIPLASTIRDVNHLSMNMLLYWQVLQLAIKKGYKYFDFGRSTKDAGTYNFKKQWGAKAKPLYWHYWLRDGDELPGLNPNNPKFALVIFLWKRLPVSISKWLGPHIVKNIP